MHLNKLNGDSLSLRYPASFNPWNNPEFSGRILFVGGIHKECDQEELHGYLKAFDNVLWVRIEADALTGQGKGHAFAILETKEGQERVLTQKKHRMRGLYIGISVWKSSKEYLNEKDMTMKRKIFVKRLSYQSTESDLINYFSTFGPIEKAEIRRNHADNTSRKIAFVTFEKESDAVQCMSCKMHLINGREIIVKKCRNPTEVKKERSMMLDESERHHSYTYSEESIHSHNDWSFFTVPLNTSNNILNASFSLKENDDQPSFNVSSNSFFINNVSKITNTSLTENWIKGVVPIEEEEDETAESNFSPNFGMAPITPSCLLQAKEYSVDFLFIEPRFKVEARVAFYTFPGYV
jgi:RNA recognition motif-containing protein